MGPVNQISRVCVCVCERERERETETEREKQEGAGRGGGIYPYVKPSLFSESAAAVLAAMRERGRERLE